MDLKLLLDLCDKLIFRYFLSIAMVVFSNFLLEEGGDFDSVTF